MGEYNLLGLLCANILITCVITIPLCFAIRRIAYAKAYGTRQINKKIRRKNARGGFADRFFLRELLASSARKDVRHTVMLYYAYFAFNFAVFVLTMLLPACCKYLFLTQALVNLTVGMAYLKLFHG